MEVSSLPIITRKALRGQLIANKPRIRFNGRETGDSEPRLTIRRAGELGLEIVVSKAIKAPYALGNRGLWRKAKGLKRARVRHRGLI